MIFNKKLSIYLFFSLSLFTGFLFSENSSGGAKIDHEYLFPFINGLSLDFKAGLKNLLNNSGSLIHSPSFYIINGKLLNITQNILIVKILYLIICLSLPFLFYLILREKYGYDDDFIFYFSLIVFLSPYFRSSAIWLLGDNLSLIFLSISFLFFLKFNQDTKNNINGYLSVFFLIACCYIRYYYCVLYIYYLLIFFKNTEKEFIFKILFLSFFLAIPSLIYFYYVIIEFDFLHSLNTFGTINYLNSGMIILTIILFYLIPFIFNKDFKIFSYYKKRIKIIFIFLSFFFIIFLIENYSTMKLIDFPQKGGGVFIKLLTFFNLKETYAILLISLISLIILDFLFKKNRFQNYFLLITIIISLPLFTIYQKYLDPLFYLIFFGLIKSDYLDEIIMKKKINLKLTFSYFGSFYLFSLFYYLR